MKLSRWALLVAAAPALAAGCGGLSGAMTAHKDELARAAGKELKVDEAATLIADVVKMTAIVVIMLAIDTTLALITFVTLPAMVILVEYARRLMRASFRQIRVRLAAMNAFAQEHLSGIRVVQLLGRGKREVGRHIGST